jgi:hypothetical protein
MKPNYLYIECSCVIMAVFNFLFAIVCLTLPLHMAIPLFLIFVAFGLINVIFAYSTFKVDPIPFNTNHELRNPKLFYTLYFIFCLPASLVYGLVILMNRLFGKVIPFLAGYLIRKARNEENYKYL